MTELTPIPTPTTTLAALPEPTRKAARRSRRSRKRLLVGAAALTLAGVVTGTGFSITSAADERAAVAATRSISQGGSIEPEQRGVYSAVAAARVAQDARDTISQAQSVLAAADGKVDASALQSSLASLGDYHQLDVSDIATLTAKTKGQAAQTQAATEEFDRQAAAAAAKAAADAEAARQAALAQANTPDGAKATARSMAASQYGWGDDQFSCLSNLWTKESGWNYQAYNAGSGATGIPQSLPGSKMASAGADWQTNAATQIAWGLDYIKRSYGTPCGAWSHSQAMNWY